MKLHEIPFNGTSKIAKMRFHCSPHDLPIKMVAVPMKTVQQGAKWEIAGTTWTSSRSSADTP